jgi:hypothetical protein
MTDPAVTPPGPRELGSPPEYWNSAKDPEMSRTVLYLVIGLLAVGAAVSGYLYYQESQDGIDIQIDRDGVSIDGN